MIIGASVILREGNLLLFEIQKPSKWIQQGDRNLSIGMGCIGGRVEGHETPRETLEREVLEEIGCEVALERSDHPFGVDPEGNVEDLEAGDLPEGAAFAWQGNEPGFIRGAQVAVYLGRPVGHAVPGDLPALIRMSLALLVECGGRIMTVQQALEGGAILKERINIPRRARLVPVGTAKVLIGLQKKSPDILRSTFLA